MMKHLKKVLLFLIFFMMLIPIGFASDNVTLNENQLALNDNDNLLASSNIYFDSHASVDGNGTKSSPYNYLNYNRLADNSVAYFASGEYNLDRTKYFSNLTIIGQDSSNTIIKSNSLQLFSQNSLTISDITLNGLTIHNKKNFTAYNVIFENNNGAYKGSYDNVFGGAIYSMGGNVLIESSTFRDNHATYGGAIYSSNTNFKVIDSSFDSNYAYKYGGAIASDSSSDLTVINTFFNNCYTLTNAGGAIYSKESTLNIRKSNFTSCNATFGGAICDLQSNSSIDSIISNDNEAIYQGGSIYKMYGTITILSSSFSSNKALSGGAIFIDNSSEVSIKSSKFNLNEANYEGGAIYTILNKKESVTSNTYNNNKASKENNYYKSLSYDLVIGNGDYIQYIGDFSFNGILPSKYDLRDYNQVTSVKHQKSSGNCWAFTSLAALESCILKASNQNFDLSEENMKNVMAFYSDYGWQLTTNKGGYDDMGVGYLVSWLGAVQEDLETFSDYSVLSPVLNSTIHVQNVIYLTRSDYTDNDDIKEAIIKYGAVATGIYYSGSYMKSNSYYYPGTNGPNHAITIVGWDDNYSKSNFKTSPPGDGAWICKNSWGETWGNNGYFYVSYYDTKCARLGDYDKSTYTIILNDTVHYDKNYQYDIIGITDYLITGEKTIWYKNTFNATGNEFLTAFSTYFNTTSEWTAQIYVNNALKLTQNGKANAGYYTFNLNKNIPLKTGDAFTIVLKISTDKLASIPISEKVRSNRILYSEGVSFFSFDGKNWIDLFDYKADMSEYGHTYDSQVACIKAFTSNQLTSNMALSYPKVVNINSSFDVVATVKDASGKLINQGKVTFTIDSKKYTASVVNGKASIKTKLSSKGSYNILANYEDSYYSNSVVSNIINADFKVTYLTINIADIYYGDKLVIENTLTQDGSNVSGNVNVKIGSKTYSVISNTKTAINDLIEPGEYIATASYDSKTATTTFNVNKIPLSMSLNIEKTDVDSVNIVAKLSKPINETVIFKVNSKSYAVKSNNGLATLTLSDLDYAKYTVEASFSSNYYENASTRGSFSVDYIKTNLSADDLVMYYHDNSRFYVTLKDKNNNPLSNQNIIITINGVDNKKTTNQNGSASIGINLNSGNYDVKVSYSGNGRYLNSTLSRNINVKSTVISSDVVKYYRNGTQFYATILDYSGNKVADKEVKMNINGVFYTRKTNSDGIVKLNLNLVPGVYVLTVTNPITDENAANTVTILSRLVENNDLIKYYRNASRYSVKVLDDIGSPITGVNVTFNINGVFYNRLTNSDGVASLAINLNPGKYIITAQYGDSKVSNTITVLSIIKTKDITMKYRDGTKFGATILDGYGNPYPNQSVTFNINGVFYTRITNSTGVANLNINLQSGKYIITTTFNGLSASNTVLIESI